MFFVGYWIVFVKDKARRTEQTGYSFIMLVTRISIKYDVEICGIKIYHSCHEFIEYITSLAMLCVICMWKMWELNPLASTYHAYEVLKGELNSASTYVHAQLTKDQLFVHHINALTKINVKITNCELPTSYCLQKLHKCPYKSRFISNSSHCSTTILSKHITSALTAVKDYVMKYSETTISHRNVNYFGPFKFLPRSSKSCRIATFRVLKYLLSTFQLYTPHYHMILSKQKCCLWSTGVSTKSQNLTSVLHLRQDYFSNKKYNSYRCWSCAELCEAFTFLVENICMCAIWWHGISTNSRDSYGH